MDIRIEQADGGALRRHADGVAALVRDAVESGASIGFVLPLGDDVLAEYAEQVAAEVDDGSDGQVGPVAAGLNRNMTVAGLDQRREQYVMDFHSL